MHLFCHGELLAAVTAVTVVWRYRFKIVDFVGEMATSFLAAISPHATPAEVEEWCRQLMLDEKEF